MINHSSTQGTVYPGHGVAMVWVLRLAEGLEFGSVLGVSTELTGYLDLDTG